MLALLLAPVSCGKDEMVMSLEKCTAIMRTSYPNAKIDVAKAPEEGKLGICVHRAKRTAEAVQVVWFVSQEEGVVCRYPSRWTCLC